jgi:hypothetical protein
MPEPKTDRSAMGLLKLIDCSVFFDEELAAAALHARNVDKQRRRLLAERLDARWRRCEQIAHSTGAAIVRAWGNEREPLIRKQRFYFDHASKLRTIAARLRGTE